MDTTKQRKMHFILLLLFTTNCLLSWQSDSIWEIYFKELQFEVYLPLLEGFPNIEYPIVINESSYNSNAEYDSISVTLFNDRGSARFLVYDSSGNCKLEGQYYQSIGVLSEYVMQYDPIDGKLEVGIIHYYQPLPDSFWVYFNVNGDTMKVEKYDRGMEIIHDK